MFTFQFNSCTQIFYQSSSDSISGTFNILQDFNEILQTVDINHGQKHIHKAI